MKNNNFIKNKNVPKKKKKASFYVVLCMFFVMLVGSILGTISFIQVNADYIDSPDVSTGVLLTDGTNLSNRWIGIEYNQTAGVVLTLKCNDDVYTFSFERLGAPIYDVSVNGTVFTVNSNSLTSAGMKVATAEISGAPVDLIYFDNVLLSTALGIDTPVEDFIVSSFSSGDVIYFFDMPAVTGGLSGVDILNLVVSILVGGIVALGTGIGTGLSTLAESIFISNGVLSTFGVLVCVFAGISLCVGLSKLVCRWISSLGGSKMG